MYKKYIPFLLLILISFFAIKPLLQNGFFPVHDNVQVERVYEMGQALKDGQFPVRIVKDLGYGYGYPLFNFYAPLPYYAGGIFFLMGIDVLTATKLMFIIGIILAGISMFLLANEIWGKWGGILSAVLYIYSPYHALDIYVRGAVGEFWAMGFLPLVFLGLYKIYKGSGSRGIIIGTIGLTGVILSHNLTALMLIPFLAICVLIMFLTSSKKLYILHYTFYIILIAAALSAFYWLPALSEMKYTNVFSQIGGGADFHKHFINYTQIWDFPWGYGGSAGTESGISYKIGKLNIILWFAGLLFFIVKYKKNKNKVLYWICITGFLLSVFLTNNASVNIWNLFGQMAFIQYPWRFLIFGVFFSSLLSGFLLSSMEKYFKLKMITCLILIISVIYFQAKYFAPQYLINIKANDYTGEENLKWKASKISDEYLPNNFQSPKSENEISYNLFANTNNKTAFIVDRPVNKSNIKIYQTKSDSAALITLPVASFPGWQYFVDGNKILPSIGQLASFTIPKGNHTITAKFTNTPVRSFANLLSLLGIVFSSVILWINKYEKNT